MSIQLSTYKNHYLTDMQHSIVFNSLGFSNVSLSDYAGGIEVNGSVGMSGAKVSVSTGIGFVQGRMFEITDIENYNILKSYFRIYVTYNGADGVAKITCEEDDLPILPKEKGDNIIDNPNGIAHYNICTGIYNQENDTLDILPTQKYYSLSQFNEIIDEMQNSIDEHTEILNGISDSGWRPIGEIFTMETGYTIVNAQYRIVNKNRVEMRGQIQGTTGSGVAITIAHTNMLPTRLHILATVNELGNVTAVNIYPDGRVRIYGSPTTPAGTYLRLDNTFYDLT